MCCFTAIVNLVDAQDVQDTLQLREVEVKSKVVTNNSGFKRIRIDSCFLVNHINADLSTILSQYSTVFIKSYGAGNLATPSFRGTTAQHTQVEWNGISMNSPMLGQVDLSQIPVSQFDGLEILYGASGITRVSGAFGGVINLFTNPDWNNRLNIMASQTAGSFGTFNSNLNVVTGTPTFQSHTKFNYSVSSNNFSYYNVFLGQTVKQKSAAYAQYGVSEELFWKIKDKHLISVKFRYNNDDRNLPPITVNYELDHLEKLKTRDLFTVVDYKFIRKKYHLTVRSAFANQEMHYKLDSSLDVAHQYYQWINKIAFSYSGIKNFTFKPGADFTYDQVNSESYNGIKTRLTTSLYGECNYQIGNIVKSSLIIREDIIDGKFLPVVPALGIEFLPWKTSNYTFSLNLARNYRYPTLNDLYWTGAGNPDLKPETNYSVETGANFNFSTKNQQFTIGITLTGYYNWIYQMITWSPVNGNSSLWKPENIDEIRTRGIETGLKIRMNLLLFNLLLNNNYNLCHSTYEKASSSYDEKIGKQLIYVPVHTFNSTLSIVRWGFYLNYNFCYYSDRYFAKDNLSIMPAYSLSNIIFGKNIRIKLFILSLQLDINNVFNLDYESVSNMAMPGRNFAFTLKLKLPSLSNSKEVL